MILIKIIYGKWYMDIFTYCIKQLLQFHEQKTQNNLPEFRNSHVDLMNKLKKSTTHTKQNFRKTYVIGGRILFIFKTSIVNIATMFGLETKGEREVTQA